MGWTAVGVLSPRINPRVYHPDRENEVDRDRASVGIQAEGSGETASTAVRQGKEKRAAEDEAHGGDGVGGRGGPSQTGVTGWRGRGNGETWGKWGRTGSGRSKRGQLRCRSDCLEQGPWRRPTPPTRHPRVSSPTWKPVQEASTKTADLPSKVPTCHQVRPALHSSHVPPGQQHTHASLSPAAAAPRQGPNGEGRGPLMAPTSQARCLLCRL